MRRSSIVEASSDVVGRLGCGLALSWASIALNTMCNEAGCLMRASNASGESFYLDSWHLNPQGSEFLVNVIAPQLISIIDK